jgi:hypothetical protein
MEPITPLACRKRHCALCGRLSGSGWGKQRGETVASVSPLLGSPFAGIQELTGSVHYPALRGLTQTS